MSLHPKASNSILIAIIISLLPVSLPIGSFEKANAEALAPVKTRTQYNLIVNLDYNSASLTAKETVLYTNDTPTDLRTVVFNVTPAQFKAFTLISASVDGRNVTPSLEGMVMEVTLPEVLRQGKSANIELNFRVNVPKRGGRFGTGDGIIALGNWFPIVAVYVTPRTSSDKRTQGWSKNPYVEVGDAFYSETSDYEVTVNTSSPVIIAHTGVLVGKDPNRWQISAKGVRDFAMAISNRFQTLSKSVDSVVITAYYLPEHAKVGSQYLEAAAQALSRLNRLVLPYPYPTLQIAEVFSQSSIAQGQEYPNLVFISSTTNDLGGGIDSYLAYVVMHEVAHQWFYGIVGNDQVFQPWLDEAMVTWFAYHVLRVVAPDLLPQVWQKRLLEPLAASIRQHGDSPVDKGIYDFADELHYYNIVYRKGALFIEELYKTMGNADFFRAMKDYAYTFRDRIVTSTEFLDFFQSRSAQNLNPIITKYFSYNRYKAKDPLRITVEFPPGQVWSGALRPRIAADHPITNTTLFIEDQVIWTGNTAENVVIDTTSLTNREEYLLTIRVSSAGQIAERVQRFQVDNGEKKETAPVSSTAVSNPSSGLLSQDRLGGFKAILDAITQWPYLIVGLALSMGLVYAVRRAR